MPALITAYRIFIATPGGLEPERERFRQLVSTYNDMDALEKGVLFIPVGWEYSLGGVGRPQALVNEELKRCDFFVLILWNRWGSRPAKAGPYTSGTEEEYQLARTLLADPEQPMRQLVLFFKAVDSVQLSDPGDQLKKVLAFKEKIESEKELLFNTYDNIDGYSDWLRKHLAGWVRQHEKGLSVKPKADG